MAADQMARFRFQVWSAIGVEKVALLCNPEYGDTWGGIYQLT
jgi:hypothetical protein